MSTQVSILRGTAAQNATFTGVEGEVTYSTDAKRLITHDGITVGGELQAKLSEVTAVSVASTAGLALKVNKAGDTMTGLLDFSGTGHFGLKLNSLTTTQRDTIGVGSAGTVLWNTTTSRYDFNIGGSWKNFVRLDGDTMTGQLVLPVGVVATPGLRFSAGIGIYSPASSLGFVLSATERVRFEVTGVGGETAIKIISSARTLTGVGFGTTTASDTYFTRTAANVLGANSGTTPTKLQVYETTDGAFSVFSRLSFQAVAGNHLIRTEADSTSTLRILQVGSGPRTGTDLAGANTIGHGGQGTGTGVGGSYLIQVAPAGSTGAGVNALVTSVSVDSTHLITTTGRLILGAALSTKVVALTDAATIATDAALGNHYRVTLAGNRTLGNPTNAYDGARIVYEFIQDGTGTRTITLDTNFALGTDITAVTLTTTASKRDFMTVIYNSTAVKWYVVAFIKGY